MPPPTRNIATLTVSDVRSVRNVYPMPSTFGTPAPTDSTTPKPVNT